MRSYIQILHWPIFLKNNDIITVNLEYFQISSIFEQLPPKKLNANFGRFVKALWEKMEHLCRSAVQRIDDRALKYKKEIDTK